MMTFDNGAAASETESEDDTSETEIERVEHLKKVKVTLNTFRNYLLWSNKHSVKVELVKSGFVEIQNAEIAPIKEEKVDQEFGLDELMETVTKIKQPVKQESPKSASPSSSSDSDTQQTFNTSDLLVKMKQTGDLSKRRIQPTHFTSTSDILKGMKENKT